MNKVILYIATSLDGFIADIHGGVDWLPQPQTQEDLDAVGYTALMERIDVIAMGSKSFEQILTFGPWGWPDKQTYVFTAKPLESDLSCIAFVQDTPREWVAKMRQREAGKDIWLLGGAQLAQSFAQENLIDEIVLTIVPQKLGSGIALGVPLQNFELREEKVLMDGMVQKTYRKK